MFPEQMELMSRERQDAFLQAAEQRRMLKLVAAQQATRPTSTERMRCWLGVHLVNWGMKLQGAHLTYTPQYSRSEPCNC